MKIDNNYVAEFGDTFPTFPKQHLGAHLGPVAPGLPKYEVKKQLLPLQGGEVITLPDSGSIEVKYVTDVGVILWYEHHSVTFTFQSIPTVIELLQRALLSQVG